jgi:hypothetical protein
MNTKEYEVTQIPDRETYFTTKEVAVITGCAFSSVGNLAKKANLKPLIRKTSNSRCAFWSYRQMRIIQELFGRRKVSGQEKPVIINIKEEKMEEHPLVTDPKFLNLSYFPDVTPKCFEEDEEEENE